MDSDENRIRNLNNGIAKLRMALDNKNISGLVISENEVAAILLELDKIGRQHEEGEE